MENSRKSRPRRSYSGNEKPNNNSKRSHSNGNADSSRTERSRRSFDRNLPDGRGERPRNDLRRNDFQGNDRSDNAYPKRRIYDKPNYGEKTKRMRRRSDGNRPDSKSERPSKRRTAQLPDYNYDKIENYRRVDRPPKYDDREQEKAPNSDCVRLNRFIANAGVCSRREADELIKKGKIQVNGTVVSELGYKVHIRQDVVTYNGERLSAERKVYVLLNKPKDYITTVDDPQERRTVMELVANACEERIYPVGRLDRMTTGLLLLTNDGELARKLSHPSSRVKKIYMVKLNKPLTEDDEAKLRDKSFALEDGEVNLDGLSVTSDDRMQLGIQLHSGKNRIVRRIFEHLGYEVVKLDRTVYADLTKKGLPRGKWRFLTQTEVIRLKYFIGKQQK